MPEALDAMVVGAGVVGLAVARALARSGREVIVIERERAIGQHASSRNSEVLHAGIYYPPGSLKARLCVQGRRALVRYCRDRGVEHRLPGKLIVATEPSQQATLQQLLKRARANGVEDLQWLDQAQVRAKEPRVRATAALWSPATGIIDSHGLMRSLLAEAEDHGAVLALDTTFEHARRGEDGRLWVQAGDDVVRCEQLVVAAGMGAVEVARRIDGLAPERVPRAYLLKGSYFALAGPPPFSHLVYPVPDTASLGIHVTLDLGGGVRFGPDQQWIDRVDYEVDPRRASVFAESIARYFPEIDADALRSSYAGIRAKIHGPGQPATDFVIDGPQQHGVDGLCALFGIESPGLTSSLAIADEVLRRLGVAPQPE